MNITHILILGFAIWRFSRLVSTERGPWEVFEKYRRFVGIYYTPANKVVAHSQFAKGLACIECSSIWWSAIASLFYVILLPASVWWWLPLTFALSAIAIIVDKIVDG